MEQTTTPRAATAARTVTFAQLVYWFCKRLVDIVGVGASCWSSCHPSSSPSPSPSGSTRRAAGPLPMPAHRPIRTSRSPSSSSAPCEDGSHHHLEEMLTADEERRLEYGTHRKLRHDPRVTRVGNFLRRTSLDELPQLLSVLTGRDEPGRAAAVPSRGAERTSRGDRILSVRPGLTGLWQVNGRSDRTFEERLALRCRDTSRDGGSAWTLASPLVPWAPCIGGRGAY